MKKIKIIISIVIIAGLVSVGAYKGYLFSLRGKALSYYGDVKVFKADKNKWESFDKSYKLKEGDILKTGPGSSCDLIFGQSAEIVIKLEENTVVKPLNKELMGIELVDGDLLAAITTPFRDKRFTIKTPNGVCGARGTGWKISVKDNSTEITVFDGRVKFGKSEGMYANDPFITREGKTLNVVSDGGVEYNYGNVDESEYLKWNEWAKKSSKQLMSVGIVDYIKTGELDPYPVWQKGMTYVSWQPMGYKKIESQMSFPRMEKETNASWVNIVTTWYQEGVDSTEIIPHPDKTPNEEALEFMFKRARRLGLHIMFTPLVDLLNKEGGVWRSDISFHTNEEWDAWFASYRNFILKYAEVAEKNDMDIFNVGTELYFTTSKRPDKWVELIKDVRKVFSGRLIYTANWFEEYKEVRFWEYLDYAGISAYFPLADDDKPSYGEIKKNCEKWAVEIEAWQKIHGKPVVFSEVGYKSIEGAAKEPWNFISGGKVDIKQQYNCYKAVLETFWDKEWFYGMYWWAWRTNVLISGKFHRGYTPYDKPAAKLLYKWYMKPDPHKYISKVRLVTDLLEKRAE